MPKTAVITGPNIPATAADGGGSKAWSNVNNSKVEDGVVATSALIGPGGGGGLANQLNLTGFGFNIPALAVIDGIKLEAKVNSDAATVNGEHIYLLYNGGQTSEANSPNTGQNWFGGLKWNTYGNSTSLWGRVWTPAEVNHANFGASLSAQLGTGTGLLYVDAVRITVFWHYALPTAPADVPTRFLYKVSNNGSYLGILPKVTSKFGYTLDINSLGSTINVECGVSADTASQPGDRLVTEAGDPLTDEAGNYLYTDGQPAIVSRGISGDPTLIQNGNRVEVWQYDYYNPNGKCVFVGQMRRVKAGFGDAAANKVSMVLVSTGADFDDYVARGGPFSYTNDVSQTANNAVVALIEGGDKGGGWTRYGQSWVVGAGAAKLGAISLLVNGDADVTISVYDGPNGNFLGSMSKTVHTGGTPTVIQFGVASLINTTVGGGYFFAISLGSGQSLSLYYSNADPYANGQMYISNYGGGSGGGGYSSVVGSDLYFITAYGLPTTSATYTSKDPTTGMLIPILDDYQLRGGKMKYDTSGIDATGLSLTVNFISNTILDAIKKVLSVSPSGFYYYADLGSEKIYFKQTLSAATLKFIKGRHLTNVDLEMSIENVKNDLLFTGGETAPNVNLFREYTDATSRQRYGQRLAQQSDNRVTLTPTADAIGTSFIVENKDEYFETSVTISAKTMDLTLLKPGITTGLRSFGGFIETLVLQISHVEMSPESATLTIGNLPPKFSNDFEDIIRGLVAQQTVNNPTSPS